ncbi:MAG: SH3 domain-containing protein [Sarcina sp.]
MKNEVIKKILVGALVSSTISGVTATTVLANEENAENQSNGKAEMLSEDKGKAVDGGVESKSTIVYARKHSIMGSNEVSKEQFKSFLLDMQKKHGFKYNLTVSLDEFLKLAYEEGAKEGVRGDIVVAQAIHETGYFKFGGVLTAKDNNFCGLGVTGDGSKLSFSSARIGLRAQVQHLKAYSSKAALNNAVVDPRFSYVTRGIAPSLEELAGKWAVPGYDRSKYSSLQQAANNNNSYGQRVYHLIETTKKYSGTSLGGGSVEEDSKPDNENNEGYKNGQVIGISSSLNVRSGAGTNYSTIGSLKNGETIKIIGEKSGWYEISYSGKVGYVSKKYIKITGEVKPENPGGSGNNSNGGSNNSGGTGNGSNSGGESVTEKVGQVTVSSTLNVRAGAGTNQRVIGTLKNGAKVNIISEENGWYKISHNNGTGYVSKKYIKIITENNGGNSNNGGNNSNQSSNIKTIKVNSALNVRSGAGTNHSVIGSLYNGNKVTVKGEEGSWYKIDFQGKNGFISKSYCV